MALGFDLCVQMAKYHARAHSCLVVLLQGCNMLKMPFVAVEETKSGFYPFLSEQWKL